MKLFAFSLRDFDELGFLEELSQELGFEFGWTAEYPSLENAHLAEGADALSIMTNPMTPELLDCYRSMGIKAIATRSIGYDHIDLEYAHKIGMRVGHAAYPPESVANYAIMLMLMTLRRVPFILSQNAVQDFSLEGKLGRDISSCTVGVVGTGAIGACVIRHLTGFGCRILAYDPFEKEELKDIATYTNLQTLLEQSDAVTLHAPGLPPNHHMIGAPELASMKQGAVIVNAARGSLIDTGALIDSLESGHLGGAALDTIEHESNLYYLDKTREILPNRDRAVLMALPNVIVSPHMAFYTHDDVKGMVCNSTRALIAFVNGEESPFEVR